LLPNDSSFTFVSDCHGTTSWLDHCLTSDSVHNCISSIKIMQEIISYDHKPISLSLYTSNITFLDKNNSAHSTLYTGNIKWSQVTSEQKLAYSEETKLQLLKIHLPLELTQCNIVGCNNNVHVGMINTLSDEIVLALSAAAKTTISQLPTRPRSFKTLPG